MEEGKGRRDDGSASDSSVSGNGLAHISLPLAVVRDSKKVKGGEGGVMLRLELRNARMMRALSVRAVLYCTVRVGSHGFQTLRRSGGSAAEWNETFYLALASSQTPIELALHDGSAQDSLVAHSQLHLDDVHPGDGQLDFLLPMRGPSGSVSCELSLQLTLLTGGGPRIPWDMTSVRRPTGQLSTDLGRLERLILGEPFQVLSFVLCTGLEPDTYDGFADALMTVHSIRGVLLPMVRSYLRIEISRTKSGALLLRQDTLATKLIKHYAQRTCREFLVRTLGPLVQEVVAQPQRSLEVNPSRMDSVDATNANLRALHDLCARFLDAIFSSAHLVPVFYREVARFLYSALQAHFQDLAHLAVAGLVFLRYVCAAIVSPQEWGLCSAQPQPKPRRNLILIAKVLQNLANDVYFGDKEPYMKDFNLFITGNKARLHSFVTELLTTPQQEPSSTAEKFAGRRPSTPSLNGLPPTTSSATPAPILEESNSEIGDDAAIMCPTVPVSESPMRDLRAALMQVAAFLQANVSKVRLAFTRTSSTFGESAEPLAQAVLPSSASADSVPTTLSSAGGGGVPDDLMAAMRKELVHLVNSIMPTDEDVHALRLPPSATEAAPSLLRGASLRVIQQSQSSTTDFHTQQSAGSLPLPSPNPSPSPSLHSSNPILASTYPMVGMHGALLGSSPSPSPLTLPSLPSASSTSTATNPTQAPPALLNGSAGNSTVLASGQGSGIQAFPAGESSQEKKSSRVHQYRRMDPVESVRQLVHTLGHEGVSVGARLAAHVQHLGAYSADLHEALQQYALPADTVTRHALLDKSTAAGRAYRSLYRSVLLTSASATPSSLDSTVRRALFAEPCDVRVVGVVAAMLEMHAHFRGVVKDMAAADAEYRVYDLMLRLIVQLRQLFAAGPSQALVHLLSYWLAMWVEIVAMHFIVLQSAHNRRPLVDTLRHFKHSCLVCVAVLSGKLTASSPVSKAPLPQPSQVSAAADQAEALAWTLECEGLESGGRLPFDEPDWYERRRPFTLLQSLQSEPPIGVALADVLGLLPLDVVQTVFGCAVQVEKEPPASLRGRLRGRHHYLWNDGSAACVLVLPPPSLWTDYALRPPRRPFLRFVDSLRRLAEFLRLAAGHASLGPLAEWEARALHAREQEGILRRLLADASLYEMDLHHPNALDVWMQLRDGYSLAADALAALASPVDLAAAGRMAGPFRALAAAVRAATALLLRRMLLWHPAEASRCRVASPPQAVFVRSDSAPLPRPLPFSIPPSHSPSSARRSNLAFSNLPLRQGLIPQKTSSSEFLT